MWQVAGGHGQINQEAAISEMLQYHEAGLTTWDMADIYGPAEEFLGQFRKRLTGKGQTELAKIQALTKFVPGILVIAGVLTRISASILSAVMLGVIFYIDRLSTFVEPNGAALAVILLAALLVLITTGPGKISISHLVKKIPRFLQ